MAKRQKIDIAVIMATAISLFVLLIVPVDNSAKLIPYIAVYLLIGYEILFKAGRNILSGEIFDENFLMSIATIGAFAIAEYPEAVSVMLFYRVGEFFQDYVLDKSRKSISDLVDIKQDYANVEVNGELIKKDPHNIKVGDIIYVKPGERIPLDGVVIEGSSSLDASALTGESMPKDVSKGDSVLSGCINLSGLLTVKVEKPYTDSTASKILELVEYASAKKARTEKFITRFARIYTPVVVFAAAFLAVLPPLLIQDASFKDWIHRALIFLVVSCPCALVISIPLGFFGGIGRASKRGILVKGGNYLENMAMVDTMVFDKTGTLTEGTFEVTQIVPRNSTKEELLRVSAHAEGFSNHPIAESIIKVYGKEPDTRKVRNVEEIAGHGIKALLDGELILVGNDKLMEKHGIKYDRVDKIGTVVHAAKGSVYLGYIVISDKIKIDTKGAVESLKREGVHNLAMLTGDSERTAVHVAKEVGIRKVYSSLLPQDKVSIVEKLLAEMGKKKTLVFVGDGMNDAPVLMRADVGIAMGALGSDSAIEAADIVIMDDKPSKIPEAVQIAKKTVRIVKQNITIALFVKILVLLLGAFGFANMWAAVFADVGVSIITILNAVRIYKGY